MPYYEFFIYARSKKRLIEIQETLVNLWEFDPTSTLIRRTRRLGRPQAVTTVLSAIGIRRKDDWLMTLTGPEIHRERVYTVAAAWEGFCDGGGYDFGYDPYTYYSDERVRVHTEAWERSCEEAEARLLASLPPEERDRIHAARRDLLGHLRAHEDDED